MRRTYHLKTRVAMLLVLSLLCLSLLLPYSASASSSTTVQLWIGNASMSVNGVQQSIDAQGTQPIISGGRTLLPIRSIIEAFGGSVAWEPSTSKITVTMVNRALELWLGKSQASLNGAAIAIDSANSKVVPFVVNGRTMLPLRFVAESMGLDVQYDDSTKKITLQEATPSWTTLTMDSEGLVGSNSAVAVDSNEKVHISYIDSTNEKLKYMTNASGEWITWTIGSASDRATSIAVDANGKCHIVYEDNGDLKYATNASSADGLTTTIEAKAWSGMFGSHDIALDSNGNPHISFFSGAGTLKYATRDSGVFSTSVVMSSANASGNMPGYSSSIGVDSNNKIHISFYDDAVPDSIKYVNNSSGSWVATTISTIGFAAGWSTSLAVDSNDKIHVTYYEWSDGNLIYATNASGTWQTEIVGDSSFTSSLAIDKTNGNQVHVVYSSGSGFMYATKLAGTWQKTKLDESWTGGGNICIGANSIHISYQDGYNNDLKYAWKPLP